jgi:hypothetical protein
MPPDALCTSSEKRGERRNPSQKSCHLNLQILNLKLIEKNAPVQASITYVASSACH